MDDGGSSQAGPGPHPRVPSTRFLYVRAHEGDRPALESLLHRVQPRLESWVALRLGSDLKARWQVDDVVQEIMMKAYQRLADFEPRERNAFYAWLFTVARSVLLDHRKKLRASKRDIAREKRLHSNFRTPRTSPSLHASRNEEREHLVRAMARLPPRYAEILRLRTIEHLSTEEAARKLGITRGNVTVLLTRARQALAELMNRV